MKNYNSLLTLQKLVFDKIEFDRKGFKNKNELTFELQVQIGIGEDSVHCHNRRQKDAKGHVAAIADQNSRAVCIHTANHKRCCKGNAAKPRQFFGKYTVFFESAEQKNPPGQHTAGENPAKPAFRYQFPEIIRRNRCALQIRKLSFQLHRLEQEIPDSIQNPLQIHAAVCHIVARHAIGRTKIKGGAKPQRIIRHQSGRNQHIGHNKRSCLSPALL